jgi:hypothetical protein
MPANDRTGKGNIYNSPANLRSGSRGGGAVGKMCKVGGRRSGIGN